LRERFEREIRKRERFERERDSKERFERESMSEMARMRTHAGITWTNIYIYMSQTTDLYIEIS